ncbi:hypothetical protein [Anaeromyxobacter terrae]|uniref:hypothetical protein n=1 Tax=Anaeromyxobacter terrae TaxID=2925406 RepID=UPI001F57F51A|nr:hypothetical protein [Anaeromyxobacter sp. SG22]
MVDHVTRVTVDAAAPRAGALADALAARGFSVRRERARIVAESVTVEAGDAKRQLLALGFRDREFQVFLEYVRQWGVL